VARSNLPRKRKRRTAQFRNSVRVGVVLTALTAINVYVFFFRDDTAVRKVLAPSSTEKSLVDEKNQAIKDSIPSSLTGPNLKGKTPDKRPGAAPEAATVDPDGRAVEGKIGPNDTLGTVWPGRASGTRPPT